MLPACDREKLWIVCALDKKNMVYIICKDSKLSTLKCPYDIIMIPLAKILLPFMNGMKM